MPDDKKKRYAIRIAPCSSYDVGRMESWLEHMAQKGYILDKMIAGIAVFVREEPQKLRYRMCELPQDTLYEDKAPSSEQELIAICEASGWRFVAERGAFGIFATADDTVPELQTEPWIDYDNVLLQTVYWVIWMFLLRFLLDFVAWRWLLEIMVIMVVLAIPIFYWQHKKKTPRVLSRFMWVCIFVMPSFSMQWKLYTTYGFFITWFNEGSVVYVSALLHTAFFIFFFFYALAGPFKYCLRMQRGIPIDHKQNWRGKAPVYRVTSISVLVIFMYIFITMFGGGTAEQLDDSLQRWKNYDGTVPFALLEAFVPQPATLEVWNDTAKLQFDEQRQRVRDVPSVLYNWRVAGSHVEEKSDWLAPQVLYLQQEGTLHLADGQQLQGSLSVTYYETRWSWIARALAWEYERFAKDSLGDDYQILALPELDVEYALAYNDARQAENYPRLILVDGNRMAKVYFYQNPDGCTVPLEQWSQIFTEQFGV